jgi:hypothetical protein
MQDVNRHDRAEAAAVIRKLLAAVEAGDLDADAALQFQLSGAVAALDADAGRSSQPG